MFEKSYSRSHQSCPFSLGTLDLALAEDQVAPVHRLKFDLSIILSSTFNIFSARSAGKPGNKKILNIFKIRNISVLCSLMIPVVKRKMVKRNYQGLP